MAYRTIAAGWTVHTPICLTMIEVSHLPYFGAHSELCKVVEDKKGVNANSKGVYKL